MGVETDPVVPDGVDANELCGPACIQMILRGEGQKASDIPSLLHLRGLLAPITAKLNARDHATFISHPEAIEEVLNKHARGEEYVAQSFPAGEGSADDFFRKVYEKAATGRVILASRVGQHYVVAHGWSWFDGEARPRSIAVRDPAGNVKPGKNALEDDERFDGWILESEFSTRVIQPVVMPTSEMWRNKYLALFPLKAKLGAKRTLPPKPFSTEGALLYALATMGATGEPYKAWFRPGNWRHFDVTNHGSPGAAYHLFLAKTNSHLAWIEVDRDGTLAGAGVVEGDSGWPKNWQGSWPKVNDAAVARRLLKDSLNAGPEKELANELGPASSLVFEPAGARSLSQVNGRGVPPQPGRLGLSFRFETAAKDRRWSVDTMGLVRPVEARMAMATAL